MLYFPKALNIYFMAGLLTCPGLKKPSHPPAGGQWQVFFKTIIVITMGHHSSGYCSGFKPLSLFIITKKIRYNTTSKQK
jgi:hypothetical protein